MEKFIISKNGIQKNSSQNKNKIIKNERADRANYRDKGIFRTQAKSRKILQPLKESVIS